MKIHWIQHVPFEGLGNIKEWIVSNNHSLSCTKQYLNEALPDITSIDMLIVMGGSMGVYDFETYPWINTEAEFIRQFIALEKPILGICLGSQFIAAALGAKVYPGPTKEIGWFPIDIYNNKVFASLDKFHTVFHWHGDTFDLPEGATLIASTPEVKNQAYSIGKNVIGLQFHLEQTTETIANMLTNCASEIEEGGIKVQSSKNISDEKSYFYSNKAMMFSILDYLAKK